MDSIVKYYQICYYWGMYYQASFNWKIDLVIGIVIVKMASIVIVGIYYYYMAIAIKIHSIPSKVIIKSKICLGLWVSMRIYHFMGYYSEINWYQSHQQDCLYSMGLITVEASMAIEINWECYCFDMGWMATIGS